MNLRAKCAIKGPTRGGCQSSLACLLSEALRGSAAFPPAPNCPDECLHPLLLTPRVLLQLEQVGGFIRTVRFQLGPHKNVSHDHPAFIHGPPCEVESWSLCLQKISQQWWKQEQRFVGMQAGEAGESDFDHSCQKPPGGAPG